VGGWGSGSDVHTLDLDILATNGGSSNEFIETFHKVKTRATAD